MRNEIFLNSEQCLNILISSIISYSHIQYNKVDSFEDEDKSHLTYSTAIAWYKVEPATIYNPFLTQSKIGWKSEKGNRLCTSFRIWSSRTVECRAANHHFIRLVHSL